MRPIIYGCAFYIDQDSKELLVTPTIELSFNIKTGVYESEHISVEKPYMAVNQNNEYTHLFTSLEDAIFVTFVVPEERPLIIDFVKMGMSISQVTGHNSINRIWPN